MNLASLPLCRVVAVALSLSTMALASPLQAQTVAAPPTPRRLLVHLNLGVPVVTYLGADGARPATTLTPADRLVVLQQLGVGYQVRPTLRVQLTLQMAETLSGLPQGASAWTLGGAIAWAVYTRGPFFAGAGPIVAARSYGEWSPDVGLFTAVGASLPLGAGFAVGAAVQAPVWFGRRFSVSVAPALFVARRF